MKRIISIICLFVVLSTTVFANSAGPPVIVIISDGPEDLKAFFMIDQVAVEGEKFMKNGEVLFELIEYEHFDYPSKIDRVKFVSNEKTFVLELNGIKSYNNLFTLDYKNEILKEGKSFFRSFWSVAFRLITTLFAEGLLFALFKYKSKRSWLVFLIINLITQIGLNIVLLTELPTSSIYSVFVLLFVLEFFIFFVEAVGMTLLINEKKRWITFIYVLAANILSFYFGVIVYPLLPI